MQTYVLNVILHLMFQMLQHTARMAVLARSLHTAPVTFTFVKVYINTIFSTVFYSCNTLSGHLQDSELQNSVLSWRKGKHSSKAQQVIWGRPAQLHKVASENRIWLIYTISHLLFLTFTHSHIYTFWHLHILTFTHSHNYTFSH